MNISESTIRILKNFATINPNIFIENGNVIRTIASSENIVGRAEVEDKFPSDFGIYDLVDFLNTLSLFSNPVLKFNKNSVKLSSKDTPAKGEYFFSAKALVQHIDKDVKWPKSADSFSFDLTADQLTQLTKAASIMSLPDLNIENSADGTITASIMDTVNDTSASFTLDIGKYTGDKTFCICFKIANLKVIPGDYEVTVTDVGLSSFNHKNTDAIYWIATEKSSSYE